MSGHQEAHENLIKQLDPEIVAAALAHINEAQAVSKMKPTRQKPQTFAAQLSASTVSSLASPTSPTTSSNPSSPRYIWL